MVAIATATLTYLGCYRDYFVGSDPFNNANRVLNGLVAQGGNNPSGYDLSSNTAENCARWCGAHGFAISGVEYNAECYCANLSAASSTSADGRATGGISHRLEQLDDSVCTYTQNYGNGQNNFCTGDPGLTTTCGNENAIMIYAYQGADGMSITKQALLADNEMQFAPAVVASSSSKAASSSSSAAASSSAAKTSSTASSARMTTSPAPVVLQQQPSSSTTAALTASSAAARSSSTSKTPAFTLSPTVMFPVAPAPSTAASSSSSSKTSAQVVLVRPTPVAAPQLPPQQQQPQQGSSSSSSSSASRLASTSASASASASVSSKAIAGRVFATSSRVSSMSASTTTAQASSSATVKPSAVVAPAVTGRPTFATLTVASSSAASGVRRVFATASAIRA